MADLFPLPPSPPRAARGRGATPQRVRMLAVDAGGTLEFRYRPLRRWSVDLLQRAESIVADFHAALGGFRLASDAVMLAAATACETYSDAELRAALDCKRATLCLPGSREIADTKRKFIPRPENWFAAVEQWVAKSGVRQRLAVAQAAARRLEQTAARLRDEQAAAEAQMRRGDELFAQIPAAAFPALWQRVRERLPHARLAPLPDDPAARRMWRQIAANLYFALDGPADRHGGGA